MFPDPGLCYMIRPENQPELFREAGHSRKDVALSAGWIPGMLSQKKSAAEK